MANPLATCMSGKLNLAADIDKPGTAAVINATTSAMMEAIVPLKVALAGVEVAKKLADSLLDPTKAPALVVELQKKVSALQAVFPPDPQKIITKPLTDNLPKDMGVGVTVSGITSFTIAPTVTIEGEVQSLDKAGKFMEALILCPVEIILGAQGIVQKILGIFLKLIQLKPEAITELASIASIPATLPEKVQTTLTAALAAKGITIDPAVSTAVISSAVSCTVGMITQPFKDIGMG
jgi:hypothetical protein